MHIMAKSCVKLYLALCTEDNGNSYKKMNQAKCPEVFLLLVVLIASQPLKQQLEVEITVNFLRISDLHVLRNGAKILSLTKCIYFYENYV